MKEYLFLLRGGKPLTSKTEEEKKAEMQAWGAYMSSLGEKGQFVGGLPLVSGGMVVTPEGLRAEPVNAGKEGIVGGYLIIKAENQKIATELARACPHIANEGNI